MNFDFCLGVFIFSYTICEKTIGSGFTIDGVLLKDNNVTCTDLTASGTTTVTTQLATDNSTKIATTAFVKTAIDNVSGNKTIIVIAHRLSTVKNADRILFLEKGKIENEGTHRELMRTNKKYKKLLVLILCLQFCLL